MELRSAARVLTATLSVVALAREAHAQVTHPFQGVTLVRNPSRATAVVNLCNAGVSLRATQYAERMATPQQWAQPRNLEIAINADFFDFPGWTWVIGRARGQGHDWPAADQNRENRPYWQFGPHLVGNVPNGATAPDPTATEIVGGHNVIISGGHTTGPWSDANDGALLNSAHQRTSIGLSADHLTLFVMATSDAISASTAVTYLQHDAAQAGAPAVDYATNQDGGGSSQMYVSGLGQIISTGRQVNNHLGIEANGGTTPPTSCVAHYAATYHAQSFPFASEGAVMLAVGETSAQWIELTNAGTETWMPGVTFFAPTPRDMPSPLGGSMWSSPTRVASVATPVPPGSTYRFPLVFTGTRTGDFTQTFGMVQEGVTWFAQSPLGGGPPDDQIEAHVVVTPGAPDAGVMDAGSESDVVMATDASSDTTTGHDAHGSDLGAEGSEHDAGCGCRTAGTRSGGRESYVVMTALSVAMVLRRGRRRTKAWRRPRARPHYG